MSSNFEQLLDDSLSTVIMKPGSLVTGIVIDILETHLIIHVGLKSEGLIPVSEFGSSDEISLGNTWPRSKFP